MPSGRSLLVSGSWPLQVQRIPDLQRQVSIENLLCEIGEPHEYWTRREGRPDQVVIDRQGDGHTLDVEGELGGDAQLAGRENRAVGNGQGDYQSQPSGGVAHGDRKVGPSGTSAPPAVREVHS